MNRKIVGVFGVVASLWLAACGGSSQKAEGAGETLTRVLGYENDGQFGPAWDELHPVQQAIVSRDQFIECSSRNMIDFDKVTVTDTFNEKVTLPGSAQQVETTAVTVKITAGPLSDTRTFHLAQVDQGWRWMVADPAAYTNGACPA